MKKYIAYSLLLAVAAVMLSCGGKNRKPEVVGATDKTTGEAFVLQLSDSLIMSRNADTLDFGRVREGQFLMRDFKVRNAGDKPLVITGADVSCGCIEIDYPKNPIRPDQTGDMSVTLDTKGFGGWIYKTIVIRTSVADKSKLLIVIAEIE